MSSYNKSDMIGGRIIRGLGYFLFILGIIALLSFIIALNFIGFPLNLLIFIGISILILIGFIFMGLYIIPEWIKVPTLLLGKFKKMRGLGVL